MPVPPVDWYRVKKVEDLEGLREALESLDPYDTYTEGKRDKNDNPICFLGTMRRGMARVDAHFAVWFRDQILESEGMRIIAECRAQ